MWQRCVPFLDRVCTHTIAACPRAKCVACIEILPRALVLTNSEHDLPSQFNTAALRTPILVSVMFWRSDVRGVLLPIPPDRELKFWHFSTQSPWVFSLLWFTSVDQASEAYAACTMLETANHCIADSGKVRPNFLCGMKRPSFKRKRSKKDQTPFPQRLKRIQVYLSAERALLCIFLKNQNSLRFRTTMITPLLRAHFGKKPNCPEWSEYMRKFISKNLVVVRHMTCRQWNSRC